jgi:hypothetical protein
LKAVINRDQSRLGVEGREYINRHFLLLHSPLQEHRDFAWDRAAPRPGFHSCGVLPAPAATGKAAEGEKEEEEEEEKKKEKG